MKIHIVRPLMLASVVGLSALDAECQTGPDAGFGVGGAVHFSVLSQNDPGWGVAFQSTGHILVSGLADGHASVTRLNEDGSIDGSFGANGSVVIDSLSTTSSVCILTDTVDGILLCLPGPDATSRRLMKLHADGSLDTSYGNNGSSGPAIPAPLTFRRMRYDLEENVLAVGLLDSEDSAVVARFTANGDMDGSFGNNGVAYLNGLPSHDTYATTVVAQEDGKVVVGGLELPNGPGAWKFMVARLNADGSPDTGFGDNGFFLDDLNVGMGQVFDLALQADGKIIFVGSGAVQGYVVGRLSEEGSLDPTFNGTGYSAMDLGTGGQASEVALQADGKILVGGYIEENSINRFGLARYASDGQLDPTFNGVGYATKAVFNSNNGYPHHMAVQPDGKVVLAGNVDLPGAGMNEHGVVRFLTGDLNTGLRVSGEGNGLLTCTPVPSEGPITIRFDLATAGELSCEVRNASGQIVDTPFTHRRFPAGTNRVGIELGHASPGVYMVRLQDAHTIRQAQVVLK